MTGLPLVREGLKLALDGGLTAAAAELFQRLADSLEHAGSYDPARTAYLEGADYCRTRSIESTAQLCMACMSVVLWQTGEWSQAERTSREVHRLGGRDAARTRRRPRGSSGSWLPCAAAPAGRGRTSRRPCRSPAGSSLPRWS